jgi:uncharacterized membrane protein SpoIIM required for sporulation
MTILTIAAIWVSFTWTTTSVPRYLDNATPDSFQKFVDEFRNSSSLPEMRFGFSAPYLFGHNLRSTALILLAGLVSFGVLGVLVSIATPVSVGVVLGMRALLGDSPWLLAAVGLLPHGSLEIPALLLSAAAVLRIGVVLVTPQMGRSMGEVVLEVLADWAKIAVGLVVPFLALAALIEAYVTPFLLLSVFP